MEIYLYLPDGFYDGEDPKEIARFLDKIESEGITYSEHGVTVISLSPIANNKHPI
jgi:hypothetical protein